MEDPSDIENKTSLDIRIFADNQSDNNPCPNAIKTNPTLV